MKIYCYRIEDIHGNVCEVAADEMSDVVHVCGLETPGGDPLTFEAELHHLRSWADGHDLDADIHTVDLDLKGYRIAGWGLTSNKKPTWLGGGTG